MATPSSGVHSGGGYPPQGMGGAPLMVTREALAQMVEAAAASQFAALPAQPQPAAPPPSHDATVQLTIELTDGTYVGQVKNGQPHGRGTMDYHPALPRKRYEGQWKDGVFHGGGLLDLTDGSRYEGQFQNGLFHGKGVFENRKGTRRYEGEWQFGYQHGKGKMHIETDGKYRGSSMVVHCCEGEKGSRHKGDGRFIEEYEGEYLCGFPHGKGDEKYTSSKGTLNHKYKGGFRCGYYSGYGSYDYIGSRYGQWEGGGLYQGTKNTERDYSMYYKHQNTYKGQFRDGELWEGKFDFLRTQGRGSYQVKDGVQFREIDKCALKLNRCASVISRFLCIFTCGGCLYKEPKKEVKP